MLPSRGSKMPVRAAAREQPHKDHKYRDLFPSVRMRAALLALAVAVAVLSLSRWTDVHSALRHPVSILVSS